MKNLQVNFLFAAIVVLTLLACDAGSLISMLSPTATPTRPPRPTFTPRAVASPTPEESPTPETSPTKAASPTPTQRPASSSASKPAATKPPAPPPPPVPQFPVKLIEGYLCEQPGNAIWKINARVNRTGSSYFLAGYVLGAFTSGGKFLKASKPSDSDEYAPMTIGANCRAASFSRSNVDFDVSELRMDFPLTLRIIKSATDPTALSADFVARFEQPGNYFIQYHAQ